jgi:dTDP-4-dehydrorhamnose reductase
MSNQRNRILLLGNTGQLGWELNRCLATLGELTALDYPHIDYLELTALQQIIKEHKPQVIVNAAAFTAVDKAEEQPEMAFGINSTAPGVIAETSKKINALLIHFSTEYVFDGSSGKPYKETDEPNPISAYGRSKLQGEQAVEQIGGDYLIFRTSWMYSLRRSNFLKKVLTWARNNPVVKVVDDQIGNPTSARMLAEVTGQILAMGGKGVLDWGREHSGTYHCAGDGYASRFEFAQEIISNDPNPENHVYKEFVPAASDAFPMPAERPLFAALDCTKFKNTFRISLPPWQEGVKFVLQELPSSQSP